jgi:hypothetical protein
MRTPKLVDLEKFIMTLDSHRFGAFAFIALVVVIASTLVALR